MIFFIGRQNGKTTKIADWFCESPHNRTIIVTSMEHKNYLQRLIIRKDRTKDMSPYFENIVLSNGNPIRGRRGPIAIDDLDVLLRQMFGNVEFLTAAGQLDPDNESSRSHFDNQGPLF